jgi:hypothetical protein
MCIQVHYANPIDTISPEQLSGLLEGKADNFSRWGGPDIPVHIQVDAVMAETVRKAYPRLRFRTASFTGDASLSADRSFLGISDRRGLHPRFRFLPVNGRCPWGRVRDDRSIEAGAPYPFTLEGAADWDDSKHLCVVQTGVTAMTRAFIRAVDRAGTTDYPVRYVKHITAGADIAMTSNEVSFLEPCTWPLKDRLSFCSPLRFFSILTDAGFDVIELTGNHNNDFGSSHNAATIDMIERAGMSYFGGGRNRADAESVKYRTAKGLRLAFVGFNEAGPAPAWAREDGPGAARLSPSAFERLMKEARANADIVFLSIQFMNENNPRPDTAQNRYLRRAIDLGAAVAVSSSAHRPMGIEFYNGGFISYGPGNFLFDQMQTMNHRRGLILRHHFYGREHLQTEIIPFIIHDYSQPRPVSGREAAGVLDEVFRWSEGPEFR